MFKMSVLLCYTSLLLQPVVLRAVTGEEPRTLKIAVVNVSAIEEGYVTLANYRDYERTLVVQSRRAINDVIRLIEVSASIISTSRVFGVSSEELSRLQESDREARRTFWGIIVKSRTRLAIERAAIRGAMRLDFERATRVLVRTLGYDSVVFVRDDNGELPSMPNLENSRLSNESTRFVGLLNSH